MITSYAFLKAVFGALILLGLASLAACTSGESQAPSTSPTLPNIIYIMADDLGYGDLGVYGQEIIQTPNIDQLAEDGLRFTDHYAGTSVCAPSRCVLVTGMHMGHAVIRGNRQYEPHGQMPLPDSSITVAELLKQAGYATGMIGKWGLGITESEGAPNDQGWDYFYGYTDQVLAHNYYPEYLLENRERVYLANEVKYLDTTAWHDGYGSYSTKQVDYSNDLFTEKALNFIEEHREGPFLLYLPYTIPHNNGEAPPGEKQEVPSYGRFANMDLPTETQGYGAMVERLDGYVGQIRQKIEELGLEEHTLILFTSDNGPMREDSHEFSAYYDSNGPLRGFKRDLYEGGMRVPMIACWPGTLAAGTTTDHPSGFQDFLPTACELAGVSPPAYVDGISYAPLLQGSPQPEHDYLYWEFIGPNNSQAVRKGKWKAVRVGMNRSPDVAWELYDLEADLGETQNLADQSPEVLEELIQLAEEAHTPDPLWPLLYEEVHPQP